MRRYRLSLGLGCCLTLLFAMGGCASESSPDAGSLALDLVLGNSAAIDEVDWRITGGEMAPMEGTIDTSAPGATASVEVFGLPPGDGYLLELSAASNDGETTCKGSMNFNVSVAQVTEVFVMLQCQTENDSGAVRVDTRINLCGELIKVVVSPLQTSIGNDIDLVAAADDAEGDPITYLWTGSGGSIANPNAPATTYTCGQEGRQFVRIQVSNGDHCVDEWTVPVTCVEGGGTGGTGGSGASGGSGGAAGTGGTGGGCQQTCGIENDFPVGGPVDTARLNCSVMGIPVPLDFDLTALSDSPIVDGDNSITTAFKTIVPEDVVDLILNLTSDAVIVNTTATLETSGDPRSAALGLSPVPCLICFIAGTEVVVSNDPLTEVFSVSGGSIDFELAEVSVTLDAAGLELVLSNAGDDPACAWENSGPPVVTLGQSGGACTNAVDAEVLANAEYTDSDGTTFFGPDAVDAIAADCLFGAPTLNSSGCGTETAQVLANNSPQTRALLSACVDLCVADQGIDLTAECLDCYGDFATCSIAFCAGPCVTDTNAPGCIACRCGDNFSDANCFDGFDGCSGLPSNNVCNGGTGGTGGGNTGGTGGGNTGGTGGGNTGGTGGGNTGGTGGACQQTCGADNEFPAGTPVGTGDFECSVMGIPIPLSFNLTAFANGEIVDGENAVTTAAQTVIPVDVVDLIINLADSAGILSTVGTVTTNGSPSDINLMLTEVPCLVCFDPGVEVVVNIDPRTENITASGGSIDLELAEVTIIIDAAGLELILSNVGDDPACAWSNDETPTVSLGSPEP